MAALSLRRRRRYRSRYPAPPMRLLLVEDDRMIGESLQRALRLEGYAVDWVRDAAAADATLASERFDLVLLDLGLPSRRRRPARRSRRPGAAARAARPPRRDAGDRAHRARRARRPRRRPRRRRRRLPGQAVRARRAQRAHPRRAAPPRAAAPSRCSRRRRDARPGARARSRRDGAPVPLSAREFAVLEALLAAARRGAVARPARGPALRLGRGDREQRRHRSTSTSCAASSAPTSSATCAASATSSTRSASRRDELDPRPAAGRRCSACSRSAALLMGGDHLPQRARRDRGDLRLPAAADGACRCATRARSRRRRPTASPTRSSTSWCRSGPSTAAASTPRAPHSSLPARALLGLGDAAVSTAAPGAPTASPPASA